MCLFRQLLGQMKITHLELPGIAERACRLHPFKASSSTQHCSQQWSVADPREWTLQMLLGKGLTFASVRVHIREGDCMS